MIEGTPLSKEFSVEFYEATVKLAEILSTTEESPDDICFRRGEAYNTFVVDDLLGQYETLFPESAIIFGATDAQLFMSQIEPNSIDKSKAQIKS